MRSLRTFISKALHGTAKLWFAITSNYSYYVDCMSNHDASHIIDQLGGTAEVARLCHVSTQAVSKWRRDGIPAARRMFLFERFPALREPQSQADHPEAA